jgi:hypothetical protein
MSQEFNAIKLPANEILMPCPFCGSPAELNEFIDGDAASKVVCCTNNGNLAETVDECLMYLPSRVAYKPTKREAIAIWNKRTTNTNVIQEKVS